MAEKEVGGWCVGGQVLTGFLELLVDLPPGLPDAEQAPLQLVQVGAGAVALGEVGAAPAPAVAAPARELALGVTAHVVQSRLDEGSAQVPGQDRLQPCGEQEGVTPLSENKPLPRRVFTLKLDLVLRAVDQHRAHRVQVVVVAAAQGPGPGFRHLRGKNLQLTNSGSGTTLPSAPCLNGVTLTSLYSGGGRPRVHSPTLKNGGVSAPPIPSYFTLNHRSRLQI